MNKRLKTPKESWIALIFMYLIFAVNGNGRELINRVLPYLADEFHVDATQLGIIGTVAGITMVISSVPVSRWIENGKRGAEMKKRTMTISALYMVFIFLCGINPICGTLTMFILWQGIRGFFSCPGEVGEVNTVAEWCPLEKNGLFLGLHHTAYPWGTMVGGFIITGILTVTNGNWHLLFILFPIFGAIMILLFLAWSTPKRYESFERTCEERGLTAPRSSGGDISVAIEEAVIEKMPVGKVLKDVTVTSNAILGFCFMYTYVGLMFWLPLFLTNIAGISYAAAASISVLYAITGGLGQIIWGHISDKLGVTKVILICSLWLAVSFAFFRLVGRGMMWVVVMQLIVGFCSNAVYPVLYKRAQDAVPFAAKMTSLSITTTGIFAGSAVATLITGAFITAGGGFSSVSGYNTALIIFVAVCVVAAVVLLVSNKIAKNKAPLTE